MKQYIQTLTDCYKQNPPNHGDTKSVLDLLYWHYAQFNPIDNQEMPPLQGEHHPSRHSKHGAVK